jgi:hypothetical protein
MFHNVSKTYVLKLLPSLLENYIFFTPEKKQEREVGSEKNTAPDPLADLRRDDRHCQKLARNGP